MCMTSPKSQQLLATLSLQAFIAAVFTPAPAGLPQMLSVQSLTSELRPWPGFCLLWEELALTRLLNIPGICLPECPVWAPR